MLKFFLHFISIFPCLCIHQDHPCCLVKIAFGSRQINIVFQILTLIDVCFMMFLLQIIVSGLTFSLILLFFSRKIRLCYQVFSIHCIESMGILHITDLRFVNGNAQRFCVLFKRVICRKCNTRHCWIIYDPSDHFIQLHFIAIKHFFLEILPNESTMVLSMSYCVS